MTPRYLRALSAGVVGAAVTTGVLFALPGSALAAGPSSSGWWSEARQDAQQPSTTDLGRQVPGDVPVKPTTEGLKVQNTPSGPAAIAALRYDDPSSSGTLSLTIADSKSVNPPQLVACLVTSKWSEGDEQPWGDRPGYDCTKGKATGQVSGTTVTFAVDQSLKPSDSTFDFAILPDPGYQEPFEVTFAPPAYDSLKTAGGSSSTYEPPASTGSTGGGSDSFTPPASSGAGTSSFPTSGGDTSFAAPSDTGAAPAVAAPAETTTQSQGQGSAPLVATNQVQPVAAASSDSGRKLGIGLIVGLFLAVIVIMANPGAATGRRFSHPVLASMGRGPAAAGAAAGSEPLLLGAGAEAVAQPPRQGGVGRFVRERSRPPVRL